MDPPRPDPEVVCDAVAAILRKKTEAERLAIAFGLWRFARRLVASAVRKDHPEWHEAEVKREVIRRFSGGAA